MSEAEDRLHAEIARLRAELELYRELAYRDPLTNLYNRRYFEDRLLEEVSRSDRTNAPLALVIVDLDDMKVINDKHGHFGGDEVLRWTAGMLNDETRAVDVVCRLGGDELGVLLSATDSRGAETFVARIRERIEHDPARPHAMNASMGFAVYPNGAMTSSELVTLADLAMYAEKMARKRAAAAAKAAA